MADSNVSDEVKQELIEKHRYMNVEYNEWWDCTYDFFKESMLEKGITVVDINFDVSYGQGDYATFRGVVHSDDFNTFLQAHDLNDKYPWAKFFADVKEIWINVDQTRRNGIEVDLNDHTGNPYEEEDGLRWATYDTMQTLFTYEAGEFEENALDIMKDYADSLYKQLRDEYDHLTSDEVVWETIQANELHLQHEGV